MEERFWNWPSLTGAWHLGSFGGDLVRGGTFGSVQGPYFGGHVFNFDR